MGVLLGLDFGQKRIGVAMADESGIVATPLTKIAFHGRRELLEALTRLVDEYRVSKIVVGLPKTLKGQIGPAAEKVAAHVEWLKTYLDKPWVFWDERLTTQEVERVLLEADLRRSRRREVRDQLAAQRILQNYLDHQNRSRVT